MSQIMRTYLSLFVILVAVYTQLGVLAAGIETTNAREYHLSVMNKMLASNFSEVVAAEMQADALEHGYELFYEESDYLFSEKRALDVVLKHKIKIPFLSFEKEQEIRGVIY